ncbi:hypothetical protein J4234_01875 [Candidatus Woesearchaeota archaeon]|nr:hypothetical protein [Candidatus Woesearchaeota archaeon]
MDERLVEFIKRSLESGYDINRIKQALLDAGHDLKIVEEHISHVAKPQQNQKKLREFIKKHVEKGSGMEKIKQDLVNAGHDIEAVEEYISHELMAKKNRKYAMLSLVAVLVIVIAIAGIYYFSASAKKTRLGVDNPEEKVARNQKDIENFNKALLNNDNSSCDMILDVSLKSECQKRFFHNASNEIEEVNMSATRELLNKALIQRNISLCAEIKDYDIKLQCESILGG